MGGGGLSQLEHYVALTEDNQIVHLKPLLVPNILVITTNNTGTTIYKRTADSGSEKFTLENGENKFTDWNYGFYLGTVMKEEQITSFDLSNYDTSNVTSMGSMFQYCSSLTSLDLSSFNTYNFTNMSEMFDGCSGLTSLDLSNFVASNVTYMKSMFFRCDKLTYIKCKKAFKDWCITNQDDIALPSAMREGGGGTWEIV